jgi:hypothetical protein
VKYELLKARVAADLRTALERGLSHGSLNTGEAIIAAVFDSIAERRPLEVSLDALIERTMSIVMNWDVRCVGKLRELFPDSFPKNLRTGSLVAYENDDDGSEWYVERGAQL